MKLSILITLLNEELVLSQTHKAISEQLESMILSKQLSDYEILYIDDGSSDSTLELINAKTRGSSISALVEILDARVEFLLVLNMLLAMLLW
mgnify:CR=1 FL=1